MIFSIDVTTISCLSSRSATLGIEMVCKEPRRSFFQPRVKRSLEYVFLAPRGPVEDLATYFKLPAFSLGDHKIVVSVESLFIESGHMTVVFTVIGEKTKISQEVHLSPTTSCWEPQEMIAFTFPETGHEYTFRVNIASS